MQLCSLTINSFVIGGWQERKKSDRGKEGERERGGEREREREREGERKGERGREEGRERQSERERKLDQYNLSGRKTGTTTVNRGGTYHLCKHIENT